MPWFSEAPDDNRCQVLTPTRCQAIVLSEYVSNMVDIETLAGFIVAKLRYKTTEIFYEIYGNILRAPTKFIPFSDIFI
jgi:hypothetical protein